MSMVTSCPSCTTTFRITPEQLKRREGKVRCGKCSGVFDAFKSLATLPDEAIAGEAPARRVSDVVREPEPDPVDQGSEAAVPAAVQGTLDIDGAAMAREEAEAARGREAKARKRRRAWRIVAAALALLLVLQLVYAMRDQIAGAMPGTRPALDAACKVLGCVVSFPRRTDQIAIESSDLQIDPQRPSIVVLTASVRNRGSSLVAHPSLELTLTNAQDQALARRVFQPADYLSDPSAVERGMAGMAEVNVRITLDTGDLKPAGYRLFLFYP